MTEIKIKYFCSKCKKYYDPVELDGNLLEEYEPDEYEYHCPEDNVPLQWRLL